MFGFLASVRRQASDPLANTGAVEAFWSALPRDNPTAAQEAICATLADPAQRASINADRLQALLLLDRYSQPLLDAMLADLVTTSRRPYLGPRSWQGAFELSRLLGQTLGRFLRAAGDGRGVRGWREHLPFLLLRILERRRVELLLRPYITESGTRFSWKDLHEVYRVAQAHDLDSYEFPTIGGASVMQTTIELEYIRVLLQDVLRAGNFPPHDAFWLDHTVPRWSRSLVIVLPEKRTTKHRFVVDLDGEAGLTRLDRESPKNCLGLDPGPLIKCIHDEAASLRGVHGSQDDSAMRLARRRNLLGKADNLFGPVRPVIHRSGEREPVALRVEVVVGVTQIARALRSTADGPALGVPATAGRRGGLFNTQSDGSTISGNTVSASTIDSLTVAGTTSGSSEGGIVRSQLTMVDRSDSGCRLHGAASAEAPLLPGVLFAFRMDLASPWTLAVVRRVKRRLAGKRVEIGAEYVGSDARRVVIVIPNPEAAPPRAPGVELPRFSAIFLPDSNGTPGVPFRSLVLPPRALLQRDRLLLRSRSDHCTIQLGEPIEEQSGFVWSPFEILDRQLQEDPPEARNSAPPVVSQAR